MSSVVAGSTIYYTSVSEALTLSLPVPMYILAPVTICLLACLSSVRLPPELEPWRMYGREARVRAFVGMFTTEVPVPDMRSPLAAEVTAAASHQSKQAGRCSSEVDSTSRAVHLLCSIHGCTSERASRTKWLPRR